MSPALRRTQPPTPAMRRRRRSRSPTISYDGRATSAPQVDRETVTLVPGGVRSGFLQHAEAGSACHGYRRPWRARRHRPTRTGGGRDGMTTDAGLDPLTTQEPQETAA
ncbi:hypothetical protein [Streptomyces sp. STR69]|uniref:hypothetical protein n=1 Tax=Streptomyces sp. STR69 TaxID=1796942 RepID=UPI0021C7DFE7|nr:hypothetical protein [Streptomyces sp. STR69]